MTLAIGPHISIAKGYGTAARSACSIGANTFQFFTRNPRGGKAKAFDEKDLAKFKTCREEHGFAPLLAHAPYTLNPCSDKERAVAFAHEALAEDLQRLETLGVGLYNMHPGSHVGQGPEVGIEKIAAVINDVLQPDQDVILLLETMAGKGSEVGRTFEELQAIIERVELKEHMGVCLDTCHIWDGGYNVAEDLDGVLEEFDHTIGLERLKAVHLNDSKNPLGSHKDRHEKIGEGCIGFDALARVASHPALRDLPFFLETPHDDLSGYANEIVQLRAACE